MQTVTMSELLLADEERLRAALRANRIGEKGRDACVALLGDELSRLLLQYNASCSSDRRQQAAADALAASLRDTLGYLRCGRAEKGKKTRVIPGFAVALLLGAVLLGAAAALLTAKSPLAGYICTALGVLGAFAAGRLWFRESEGAIELALDPDAVWLALRRCVETMDRKLEDFSRQSRELERESATARGASAAVLDPEALRLFGALLEALYSENGAFALRQLGRVPEYLERQGVTLVSYSPDNESLFTCFPTKREGATQCPALLAGDRLLLPGKATKHVE